MAKITKNKNGLYQARLYLGRDESGKQSFKYLSDKTLKGIKRKIREVEEQVEAGELSTVNDMRFD